LVKQNDPAPYANHQKPIYPRHALDKIVFQRPQSHKKGQFLGMLFVQPDQLYIFGFLSAPSMDKDLSGRQILRITFITSQ